MAAGTLIEYRLRLHRIPIRWLTRIEVWRPGRALRGRVAATRPVPALAPHPHLRRDGGTLVRDPGALRAAAGSARRASSPRAGGGATSSASSTSARNAWRAGWVELRVLEHLRAPAPGFFDELFEAVATPRPPARGLAAGLAGLGRERLRVAGERRDAIFVQQGITFDASGPDGGPSRDRPFPLDLVPRILPADEWRTIKRGLAQRVRALNLFVEDCYHDQEIVKEGIVPWQLVVTRAGLRPRRVPASGRRAASGATCPAATWSATPTGAGRCSRTTCARRPGSRTCSRTGSP